MAMATMATNAVVGLVPRCSAVATTSSSLCLPVSRMTAVGRVFGLPFGGLNCVRKASVQNFVGDGRKGGSNVAVRATLAAAKEAPAKADWCELKADLLAAVAGLDRGLVATKADELIADTLAIKLEAAGDIVELPEDLDKLQGRWRLIFSSGFNTGSLGGERPGPRITRLPLLSIGLVYQRIDVASRELDIIVDLNLPTPWPLPPIQLTATLAHSFEVVGPATIKIIFEKTTIEPIGFLSNLPPLDLPQIQIPDFVRRPRDVLSGEFVTTFIDKDLRISRGDRGELRIFVRS